MKAAALCAWVTGFTAPLASPTGDPFTVLYFVIVGALLAFGATFALARTQRFKDLFNARRWLVIGVVCMAINVSHWLLYQVLMLLNNRHDAL